MTYQILGEHVGEDGWWDIKFKMSCYWNDFMETGGDGGTSHTSHSHVPTGILG